MLDMAKPVDGPRYFIVARNSVSPIILAAMHNIILHNSASTPGYGVALPVAPRYSMYVIGKDNRALIEFASIGDNPFEPIL